MSWEYGYHKYIHILWHDIHAGHTLEEIKHGFVYKIVDMINSHPDVFGTDNLFITPFEVAYGYLKDIENVKYVKVDNPRGAEVVNVCAPHCEWIFLHDICHPFEVIKIKKKYLNKIIWRTWGGTVTIPTTEGNPVKNLIKSILFKRYVKAVQQFRMIGIGNVVDELIVKDLYGNDIDFSILPCSMEGRSVYIDKTKSVNIGFDGKYKVMIGHSGYEADSHFMLIDMMNRYLDADVDFYIPLTSGDETYIGKVKEYAKEKLGNKVVIVEKKMPYYDYCQFINKMDVILFDLKDSNALGNISICVELGKTLYLNKDGSIKKAMDYVSYPCRTIDSIPGMTFDGFISKIDTSNNKANGKIGVLSREEEKRLWTDVLKTLG